jgi:hypothetical protein
VRHLLGAALFSAITLLLTGVIAAQTASDAAVELPIVQPVAASEAASDAELPAPQAAPVNSASPDSQQSASQQIDKRIFGVLPNYRTASGSAPYMPITAKQKFTIAAKDSFDYPVYLTSAGFAGLYQMDDQNASYGQGLKGYAKRLGSSYADQAIGNVMTEGLVPTLMHQDPRYFRLGPVRTKKYRTAYALRGVMAARNDNGKWAFNYSEWVGNAAAVGISNLYYPDDTRDALDNAEKLLVQVATDAFSNVLKEFWPDIKQKYFHKKN